MPLILTPRLTVETLAKQHHVSFTAKKKARLIAVKAERERERRGRKDELLITALNNRVNAPQKGQCGLLITTFPT